MFVRLLFAALLVWAIPACGDGGATTDAPDAAIDAPDAGFEFPPPRTDLVPPVGTASAVDIATWNIENFPKNPATPEVMADLIASLDLDLIAVQEIEDEAAFDQLVSRLRGYDGVLSTHTYGNGTYQKIGFIYRSALLEVTSVRRLFDNAGYEFPRPPLEVEVGVVGTNVTFVAIAVHLKAGFGGEDRERRELATALLEDYVAGLVGGEGDADVVVLGDFNEVVTSAGGQATLAPWLDGASYHLHTQSLAEDGDFSFVPSEALIDHVVSTSALSDELPADAQIPRLDQQYNGYGNVISDHLPVVVAMPVL